MSSASRGPRRGRARSRAGAVGRAAGAVRFDALEPRRLLTAAATTTTVAAPSAAGPGGAIVRPDHVVVVIEEDHIAAAVGDPNTPYFTQLATGGLVYTNSHSVLHPSQPDYLALFSGSTQGVTDNLQHGDATNHQFSAPNLAKSLFSAGLTFTGYAESLPADGSNVVEAADPAVDPDNHPDVYVRNRNPMAQFSDYAGHTNAEVNRTFAAFPTDYSKLPTVSFVVPDMMHNSHGSNEAPYTAASSGLVPLRQNADAWLKAKLDGYVQWAKSHNSLLIVTSDEEDTTNYPTSGMTTIVAGDPRLVVPGTDGRALDQYRLLRTVEDMYGLAPLANTAAVAPLTTDALGRLAPPGTSGTSTVAGQGVSFYATVTSGSGVPTGTVQFQVDGANVGGAVPLVNGSAASQLVTSLAPGNHQVKALYAGNTSFAASTSAGVSDVVAQAAALTTLASSAPSAALGQTVTFTANVSATSPGRGTPTGSVSFRDGTATLGTGTLDSAGRATFSTSTLASGPHTITAVYAGDANFVGNSSSALAQSVTGGTPAPGAPILAAVTDSGASSSDGLTNFDNSVATRALIFTVPNTTAGATVTVYADGTAIGSAQATGTTTTVTTDGVTKLSPGAHAITARQTPAGQAQSGDSGALSVVVDTTAPAAAAAPANVTAGAAAAYTFAVTYSDPSGLWAATLDGNDVVVTNPAQSFTQPAALVSTSGGGTTLTATYSFVPPGGAWDVADNGTYTLTLQSGQVADAAGNAAPVNTSLGAFTVNVPATPPFAGHYDFGTTTSPVASGYVRVSDQTAYSAATGYGWLAGSGTIQPRDRATSNPLTRDFDMTDSTGRTFAVDVATGTYDVTVTLGDPGYLHDQQGVYLEGAQVDNVTTAVAQVYVKTYRVTVTDGRLSLLLKDLGGSDGYTALDGVDVAVAANVTPAPGTPALAAATDSGASSSDRLTKFNNASPALAPQFVVPNTVVGATVTLYADGAAVGTATATGTTTNINANGTTTLADGAHAFTARQTLSGQSQSGDSPATTVTVDTAAPTFTSSPTAVGASAAGATAYTFTVVYADANGVDVSSLGAGDVVVSSPVQSYAQPATLVAVSPSGSGTPRTATYSVVPPGGAWDTADTGTYTLTLQPGRARDVAGNTGPATATALGTFSVNLQAPPPFAAHFDFGTAASALAAGYTRVTGVTAFSNTTGFGWLAGGGTVQSRDRATSNPLTTDFDMTDKTGATFAVNVANGTYDVTVTLGDPGFLHDQQGVYLEGTQVDNVTTAAGQVYVKTYHVTVADGQLTLLLKDLGGSDGYTAIDALDVVQNG